jgi:hypothetical protein
VLDLLQFQQTKQSRSKPRGPVRLALRNLRGTGTITKQRFHSNILTGW